MGLSVAVICGFVVALVAPILPARWSGAWARLLALVPAALFIYFLTLIPDVKDGGAVRSSYDWMPALGVEFSLRVDGLSLLMALLITGIGAGIVLYASSYLGGHRRIGVFLAFLLAFMGSMLGLVLADDLIVLFVFWELTSITSFLLISFENENPEARKGATQALLITSGGGLALLAGFLVLGETAGTYQVSAILGSGDAIRDSSAYSAILILVLAGAFTKSAQVPFHFWLPSAMVAPTPVSAYLHSATMVKAGVYLLARLHPALGDTDAWLYSLSAFGGVTMLVGAYVAAHQYDLKLILAYSTVSALGMLVALLGLGTEEAVKAAMVFLLAHALYKGALFLVAGIVDHEMHTRDIRELGGMARRMPISAAACAVGAASLAGFGPLLAFIGKEAALDAALHGHGWVPGLLLAVTVATGALFVVSAGLVLTPFFGPKRGANPGHEAPPPMTFAPFVLAALSVGFALFSSQVASAILRPATNAVSMQPWTGELVLWHGFNTALLLSIISVVAGAAILYGRHVIRPASSRLFDLTSQVRPSLMYDRALAGLGSLASFQTRLLQNGYLRVYVGTVLITAVALTVSPLLGSSIDLWPSLQRLAAYEVAVLAIIVAGAFTAVLTDSRLAAVAALGAVGFGVAMIYGLFGAPDLAMTQFLVETLTVLLFVLVFYRLPRLVMRSSVASRLRDAAIATAFGAMMTLLVLAALSYQLSPTISGYFAETSKPEAHGRNVVNVILVDFRALDTLGEIIVLSVAALGVFALLRGRRRGSS
jgi:multicomponent Na+:H+ antiporter subunit A